MAVHRITELPPAFMIGTQSMKILDAYKRKHPNAVVKRKGQTNKTLDDYNTKYSVNGRNHYITVKGARYGAVVLQMLDQHSPEELSQILSETLVG